MDREEVFRWVKEQYQTEPDYPWNDCNAVLRHKQGKKWYAVILQVSGEKLGLKERRVVDVLNLKCDPILVGALRQQEGYYPAYHMNKENWISILLESSIPQEDIMELIALSYNLTAVRKNSKKNEKKF